MRCSHNCQQCACTASNAHVRLQAIEYLNISGLVIDFATSPVRTGNSFFANHDSNPNPIPTLNLTSTKCWTFLQVGQMRTFGSVKRSVLG